MKTKPPKRQSPPAHTHPHTHTFFIFFVIIITTPPSLPHPKGNTFEELNQLSVSATVELELHIRVREEAAHCYPTVLYNMYMPE